MILKDSSKYKFQFVQKRNYHKSKDYTIENRKYIPSLMSIQLTNELVKSTFEWTTIIYRCAPRGLI